MMGILIKGKKKLSNTPIYKDMTSLQIKGMLIAFNFSEQGIKNSYPLWS